jgi:hypothetical protein
MNTQQRAHKRKWTRRRYRERGGYAGQPKIKQWRTGKGKQNWWLTKLRQRLKSYGLTIERYNDLYEQQQGRCAVCGTFGNSQTVPHGAGVRGIALRVGSLHVDHNHETGEVRGLLCNKCNRGLGMIGDGLAAAMRFVVYLSNYEKRGAS